MIELQLLTGVIHENVKSSFDAGSNQQLHPLEDCNSTTLISTKSQRKTPSRAYCSLVP